MVSVTFLLAAAASLLPLIAEAATPRRSPVYGHEFEYALPIPPVKRPLKSYKDHKTGVVIDFYEVKIREFKKRLFPDLEDASLIGYDGIAPGPTFKIQKGRQTVIRFVNEYFRPSAVHLHGSYSRTAFDGYPTDTITSGQYKDYFYPNAQSARTIWYHDHAMGATALNAYAGQAGFYIIEDAALERRFRLPQGAYDIPLMVQSRFYTAAGNITDESHELTSTYGDTYSINGQILPHLVVEPRKYRFRILNASASRSFNYTLSAQAKGASAADTVPVPMYVVASDSGFLSHPVKTYSLVQTMAERWEVVIDFAKFKGQNIVMKSSNTFADIDYEGTGNLMQFRVGNRVRSQAGNGRLPDTLVDQDLPVDHGTPADQTFTFGRAGPTGDWTINGRTFMDPTNRIIRNVPRGTTEKWLLRGGGGWPHPVHVHLVDFKITSRVALKPEYNAEAGRNYIAPYEAAAMKDVVAIGNNEEVTILAKYAPWDGVYVFHCHNLIHEDNMMLDFNVTALPGFGYKEKSRFLDPMDTRFRAQTYHGTNLKTVVQQTLPGFAALEAYTDIDRLEAAIDNYHATATAHLKGAEVTPRP